VTSGDDHGTDPPSSGAPPAAPRPSRAGRALRAGVRLVLGLTLVAVLAVVLGLALLQTPHGRTAAKGLIEAWVARATGGTLSLGALDLSLFRREAAVTDASFRLRGLAADAQRIEVRLGPRGRPDVRVVRPVVRYRDTGRPGSKVPASGLAAQPWRALQALGGAEVVAGRVELRDTRGFPWLVLGRLDAQMPAGTRRVSVRAAAGILGTSGGPRLAGVKIEATVSVEGGPLVIEQAALGVRGSALDLRGELDRVSPTDARVSAHAALDEPLVRTLAPGAVVAGRIEANGVVEVKEDAVSATLEAASPALTVTGVGPWAASARGRLAGRQLVVEGLEARGFGGRLVGEGPLALRSGATTDVRARAEGLDVAALVAALSKTEVPVAARADATLRWTTTGWDVAAARGAGELTLRPGPARPGRGPGVPVSGTGRVRIAGRAVSLEEAVVEARGARVAGTAALDARGELHASWRATLPLDSVGPLLSDVGSPARLPESYTGTLLAEGEVSGPPARLEHAGTIASEGLAFRGHPFSLEARARYAAGRLEVSPLVVRSGLGQATLAGSIPVLADAGEWELRGDVDRLDLAPVLALAGVEGQGPATGTLRVEGPRSAPRAQADLEARIVLGTQPSAAERPVALSVTGSMDASRVEVERLTGEAAGGRVEASGSYDWQTRQVQAKASASGLAWNELPLLPEELRGLDGQLGADVSLGGTPAHPSGEVHATLAGGKLGGSPLPPLALVAHADGRTLELSGRSGESTLLQGEGPLEGDWPVHLEIDTGALPLQAILDALPAAREREARVAATGAVTLDLPLRAPAGFRYSAEALRVSGKVRQREWATDPFRVRGDRESVTIGGLHVASPGATLTLDGRIPLAPSASYDLAVDGTTDLALADAALSPEDRAAGTATLRVRLAGTAANPDVEGEATVDGTRGRFEGARWRDLRLRARFVGREMDVEELSARVLGGTLAAKGRFPLAAGSGGPARLTFEAKDVDLARMLDSDLRLEGGASFLVSIAGEAEATAPSLATLQGHGRLSRLESKSPEGTFGLGAPVAWRIEDGRFELDPVRLTGPLGTLEARVEARLAGASPGGRATLEGPFDLRFLNPFLPGTTLSGPATVDLRASWGGGHPRLDGALKVDKGRLTLEELAFGLTQLSGQVEFEGDRVAADLSAVAGADGKLHAHGGMTLGPAFFGPADVTIEAQRIPIAYPAGFRGRASGALTLTGDPESAYILGGEVTLQQAYYTAEFDAGTQSIGRLDWQLGALRGGAITQKVVLDVDIRLQGPLRIRNRTAQLDVLGSLTASGTLAQPTATGQVSLREGGTLTLSRAEVRVSRGTVVLNGYPAGTPEIDLQGATRVGGVAINVTARGRMDDLQLTLDSPDRPDLSQTDLATLLLTGRTASAASTQGGVIVAEELASALGGVLQKGVGQSVLIDVSPDRSLLADDTDPTQRFTIGHRLTENLVVTYSVALDGTQQRWILDFNPGGGRFRYRVIDEWDQSVSFEVTDRFSFDLWNRGRRRGERRPREIGRLASLRFEGELPLPEEELRKATRLERRGRYSMLQREQAADRVAALLAKEGWPGASVEAETQRAADRSVDLVLHVDAGPRVTFEWSGDPVGKKERKAAQAAWPAYASPEVAAAAVARAALVSLQARGHRAAVVTPEVTASAREVKVALHVEAGRRGGAVRVVFDGNGALGDAALLAAIPKPGSREFFEELASRGSPLVDHLRLAYARAGYVDARVRPPASAVDPATGALTVTFRIREGKASPVAGIDLPAEAVAAGPQGPAIQTKVGAPFDVSAYVADREAIGTWYRAQGWPDARVVGFLEPGPEGVAVRFAARAGPRPHVGEVRIEEAGRTSESLVRRAVTLEPGDLVRPHALAESRERLAELGIFRSVEVRPEPRPGDPQVRDIVVNVATRPDVTVEYGVRYTTQGAGGVGTAASSPSGATLQFAGGLELANPFGLGWRARGYTFVTTSRQTWGVNLDAATFFGYRLRSTLLLYDDNDPEIHISGLASRVRGVTFQQTKSLLRGLGGRRWHDRLSLQWGYSFKHIVYLEDVTRSELLSGDRAFISLALVGDERDSLTDPTRGVFWTATTESAREWLGSGVGYQRYYGQGFFYLPLLGRKVVWAQGYRMGVVPGDDPQLVLENRFQAGGPTTVRGFEQNGLGPRTEGGDALGGQAVAVLNQELRFPIWKRLHGGVFWDAGNVWLTSAGFDLFDLRQSVGAGLRFMFPFGPIRVEYAWVLSPRPGETKSRLVFGLGHAF
jgi:outer membrane protein assembly complex protein YaeT